jgi:hypothetical protein
MTMKKTASQIADEVLVKTAAATALGSGKGIKELIKRMGKGGVPGKGAPGMAALKRSGGSPVPGGMLPNAGW